ncbi:MAG: amino acid adenylation domain-containing protein [Gemmatimonadales bacterium]
MSVGSLVARLREMDVVLAVEGDQLLCNAPKGALTPELRAELTARKAAVIAWLRDETRAPLSLAQRRLWVLCQLEPESTAYTLSRAVHLAGDLDVDVVNRVLTEIVRRHAALRTTFGFEDGEPFQVVHPPREISAEVVQMDPPASAELVTTVLSRLSDEARRPFDLSTGPLFRTVVLHLGPRDHVISLTVHHLVADAWSLGILLSEFRDLYEAFRAGAPSPLPEPTSQYADHARWEQRHAHSAAFDAQLAYWKHQLAGELPTLDLPADRSRPAVRTTGVGVERFRIPGDLAHALQEIARDENVSLFMLLLAVFDVMLYRTTGEPDVVVGAPVANRTRLETEKLIGFFVNTLVLRTSIDPDEPFRELLWRVRNTTLDAYANQDVHFDKLVEVLQPKRDLSRTPLFQVMLTLQNAPTATFSLREVVATPLPSPISASKTDLVVELEEGGEGISANVEYSTDLFEADTVRRLWQLYECLMRGVVADPARRVADLPMLTTEELQRVTLDYNRTASVFDRSKTLHALFEQTAQRVPNDIAVTAGDASLTYRALDDRANQLARLLRERGVTPGARVAICLTRTVDLLVSVIAVAKSGAAYVPLDPGHPQDRLRYQLDDAGVVCAIARSDLLRGSFGDSAATFVLLDEIADEWDAQPTKSPQVHVRPSDLAYVIYTSGSTGRPKGVEVEHRNVVAFLEAMRREPGMTSNDTILALTSLTFDIAGLELWLPMVVGARVVIASEDDTTDADRLARAIEAFDISFLQATPATWRMLLEAKWPGKPGLKALVGGEALPVDLGTALSPRVAELWNMYGPTETTIWSTAARVGADQMGSVPIGRPIANTRVYVLDPAGQPTPVGVWGELHIAGEGVARGYHDRPELTAERFTTISISSVGSERVFRTGDIGRWRHDGQLDFAGRRDDQIKLRGYRIELGEIEAALLAHPAVREAVVVTREAGPQDARLAAFVVLERGMDLTVSEARLHLRKSLPDYMIPSAVVELDALPLTPNRKVARQALPNPFSGGAHIAGASEPPAPGVESAVAAIWCDVLRVSAVNADDNFFELGGHSLLSLRVAAQLEERLNWRLDPRELFFKNLKQIAATAPPDSDGALTGPAR